MPLHCFCLPKILNSDVILTYTLSQKYYGEKWQQAAITNEMESEIAMLVAIALLLKCTFKYVHKHDIK